MNAGPLIRPCADPVCPTCVDDPGALYVVLTFLVRDGMAYLPRNFATLEAIGARLDSYRIIYYENDSIDGTTEWLLNKSQSDSRVSGTHERAGTAPSTLLCSERLLNCGARESLLARIRNKLLAKVLAISRWDVWLSIDMDFALLKTSQLWDAISLGQRESASAVFAVSYFVSGKSCKLMPYDAFHNAPRLSSNAEIIEGRSCGARVVSGFGGIGIYFPRIRRVPGLRYNDSTRELDHISFHTRIHEALGARHPLLADGRLRPIYTYTVRHGTSATPADELLRTKCRTSPQPKWVNAMLEE